MQQLPFRLALVSDMLEERWFSMDLIADMLFHQLSAAHGGRCKVRQIRPALKRLLSASWFTANSSRAWMLDRLLNRHVAYPRFLRARINDFDLFHIVDHTYANLVNQLPPERTIVTCHDLDAFGSILEPVTGPRANLLRLVMQPALKGMQKAAHTIFVSHAIRKTALHLGLAAPSTSSVVPMGVHPSCTVVPNSDADRQARELLNSVGTQPLLLHVGSTVKRKRVDLLLQVTSRVMRTFPQAALVRVGGPMTAEQRLLAQKLGVVDRILELPYLERDVLAAIYRRADVVLQTSEAEGFGLPVVEAMACGCPVVASDLEVLREVGGVAASYCPLGDVEQWTGKVIEIIEESRSRPQVRRERRQFLAGYAGRFSWGETTRQVVQIYEDVVRKGN